MVGKKELSYLVIMIVVIVMIFRSGASFSTSSGEVEMNGSCSAVLTTAYTYDNVSFNITLQNITDHSVINSSLCRITIQYGAVTDNSPMENLGDKYFYNLTFSHQGFYNYEVNCSGYPDLYGSENFSIYSNSALLAWDDSDPADVRKRTPVLFYANYTMLNSSPIQDANCTMHILSADYPMAYDQGTYILNLTINHSGNYSYSVACNRTGFTAFHANTSVFIFDYFQKAHSPFINISYPSIMSADTDDDGIPEILMTGAGDFEFKIYEYDYGWDEITNNIAAFRDGSIAALDYDNDGLLDLAACGLNESSGTSRKTWLYHNTGNGFVSEPDIFPDIAYCSILASDLDNDGDHDLIFSGQDGSGNNITRVYENIDGRFSYAYDLLGMYNSDIAVIDFDNDSYMDVVIMGRNGLATDPVTALYKNMNGTLSFSRYLVNLSKGRLLVSDLDDDHLPDLIATGRENENDYSTAQTIIYISDGTDLVYNQTISGITGGGSAIGDIDSDGYEDLIAAGWDINTDVNMSLYLMDRTSLSIDDVMLEGITYGDLIMIDYDLDHDLDVVYSGDDGSVMSRLYSNTQDLFQNNTPPEKPQIINVSYSAGMIRVLWNMSHDDESSSLSYHLQIGTASNHDSLISGVPVSDLGNMMYHTYYDVHAPPGNYIVKLWAIDPGRSWSEASVYELNMTSYVPGNDWHINYSVDISDNITMNSPDSMIVEDADLTFTDSVIVFENHSNLNLTNSTLILAGSSMEGSAVSHASFEDSNLDCTASDITGFGSFSINGSVMLDLCSISSLHLAGSDGIANNSYLGSLNLSYSGFTIINSTIGTVITDAYSNVSVFRYIRLNITQPGVYVEYNTSDNVSEFHELSVGMNDILLLYSFHNSTHDIKYNYTFLFSGDAYFDHAEELNFSGHDIVLSGTNVPDYSEFTGNLTTNFTLLAKQGSIENLSYAVLHIEGFGYVNFTESMNYSLVNLSDAVDITQNSVLINTAMYPELLGAVEITLENITTLRTPAVLYDGSFCASCSALNYTVPHLSFYSPSSGSFLVVPNGNITFENNVCRMGNTASGFMIRYLNASGISIADGNCSMSFEGDHNMTYINTSGYYDASVILPVSGSYNVSFFCSHPLYEPVNYTKEIYIKKDMHDPYLEIIKHDPGFLYSSGIAADPGFFIQGRYGSVGGVPKSVFFGSSFEEQGISSAFPDVMSGSIALFDYDNDGDEDYFITGFDGFSDYAALYINTGDSFSLSYDVAGFRQSSVDVADIDSDGDPDLLLCGISDDDPKAVLLINMGDQPFQEIDLPRNSSYGTCMFIDLNSDDLADILMTGRSSSSDTGSTAVLLNTGSGYNVTEIAPGSYYGSWGMIYLDNDGSYEIFANGLQDITALSSGFQGIYTNNMSLLFNLSPSAAGSLVSADINNDGYSDLITLGSEDFVDRYGNKSTTIYLGPDFNTTYNLEPMTGGSVIPYDYDDDNDLDLIITGAVNSTSYELLVYENDISYCHPNQLPPVPTISGSYYGGSINLAWNNVSDYEGGSVTYNLRIGIPANHDRFLSGVIIRTSNPANPGRGNMGFATNYSLALPDQCITYQIQAIDSALGAGQWSSIRYYSRPEVCNDGYDNDCDGFVDEGCAAGEVESSSAGGGGGGGGFIPIPSADEDSGQVNDTADEAINLSQEDASDDTISEQQSEQEDAGSEDTDGSSADPGSGSRSGSSGSSASSPGSLLYESVLKFRRTAYYSKGRTVVTDYLKNTFNSRIDDVRIRYTIPKDVISSASNSFDSMVLFEIIEDDPVIEFTIPSMNAYEEYPLVYTIDKLLTGKQLDSIGLNFSYDEDGFEESKKVFEEQLNKTAEVIDVNLSYVSDFENNETHFRLDLDFRNESILYNVSVYQEIPKCLIGILKDEFIQSEYEFEIVNEDPIIVWHFDHIEKGKSITYALKSVADDNCTNQTNTYTLAKAIYIMNKKTSWFPRILHDGSFRPGIILTIITVFAIILSLIKFTSFTYSTRDKIRLSGFLHYLKANNISPDDVAVKLFKRGATPEEINEILEIRSGLFRRISAHFKIASEELVLFIIIFINVFDTMEILPGDIDFVKKIISWTLLSYLFYRISITKTLFGTQHKLTDVLILVGMYLLSLKNLIVYSIVAIQESRFFNDLLTIIVRYATHIENYGFQLGAFMLLVISVYLAPRLDLRQDSVIGVFNMDLKRSGWIRRTVMIFLLLFVFYVLIYNLVFEWLAIAIDAPLYTLLILWYLLYAFRKRRRIKLGHFLHNIDEMTGTFFGKVIRLFTRRKYLPLGISGLLMLHILTEIGIFILPSVIGRADILYYGAAVADFSSADFAGRIQNGLAPIFSVTDPFFGTTSSIFTYQASKVGLLQAIHLFFLYLLNIVFVCSLLLIPCLIWLVMYRGRSLKKSRLVKIRYSRIFLALFLLSVFAYFSSPAIRLDIIREAGFDILMADDLIKGVELKTMPIDIHQSPVPLLIGVMVASLILIPSKVIKKMFSDVTSSIAMIFFIYYIYLFFSQVNDYFIMFLSSGIKHISPENFFLLGNVILMYSITLVLYIGGVFMFFYEVWVMDEVPFIKRYKKKIKKKTEYITKSEIELD